MDPWCCDIKYEGASQPWYQALGLGGTVTSVKTLNQQTYLSMTIINLLEHPWRWKLFLGESKLAYTHLASDTSQHLDMQMIAYFSNKLAGKWASIQNTLPSGIRSKTSTQSARNFRQKNHFKAEKDDTRTRRGPRITNLAIILIHSRGAGSGLGDKLADNVML